MGIRTASGIGAALLALVNISSVFGLISVPTQGTYNATKFAVRGFTEALRHETADTDLHVMCVLPGGIKTGIAHAARFYVGPNGSSDQSKTATEFVDKLARGTVAPAAMNKRGLQSGEAMGEDAFERRWRSGQGGESVEVLFGQRRALVQRGEKGREARLSGLPFRLKLMSQY